MWAFLAKSTWAGAKSTWAGAKSIWARAKSTWARTKPCGLGQVDTSNAKCSFQPVVKNKGMV